MTAVLAIAIPAVSAVAAVLAGVTTGVDVEQTAGAAAASTSGTAEFVVFWIMAPVSLGTALAVVVLRNPVHAALMLVVNFFTIAVLYAVLEAQFLATVQVIVYAGAIMVLFLFVIMLLGLGGAEERREDRVRGLKGTGIALGAALFLALTLSVAGPYLSRSAACTGATSPGATTQDADGGAEAEAAAADDGGAVCTGLATVNGLEGGNVGGIGGLLFTDYLWPFEVTSVLLVIAAVGAMVLGRRTEDERDLVDVPRAGEAEDEDDLVTAGVPAGAPRQRALEGATDADESDLPPEAADPSLTERHG